MLISLVVGCGSTSTNKEPEFMKYVTMFVAQYPVNVNDIPIHFTSEFQDTRTIAICRIDDDTLVTSLQIQVDRKEWASLSEFGRFWTIFHELGHCALNRSHTEATYADGCPTSIMNPEYDSNTSEGCYNRHSAEMIKELGDNRDH